MSTTFMQALQATLKSVLREDYAGLPNKARRTVHITDKVINDRLKGAIASCVYEGKLMTADGEVTILTHGVRTPGAVVHLWPHREYPIERLNRLFLGMSRRNRTHFDELKNVEKLVHLYYNQRAHDRETIPPVWLDTGWLIGFLLINRWVQDNGQGIPVTLVDGVRYLDNGTSRYTNFAADKMVRCLRTLAPRTDPLSISPGVQHLTTHHDPVVQHALTTLGISIYFDYSKGLYMITTPENELHIADPSYMIPADLPASTPKPEVVSECTASCSSVINDYLAFLFNTFQSAGNTHLSTLPSYVDDLELVSSILTHKDRAYVSSSYTNFNTGPVRKAFKPSLRQQIANTLLEIKALEDEPQIEYGVTHEILMGFKIFSIRRLTDDSVVTFNGTEDGIYSDGVDPFHDDFSSSTYGRQLMRRWLDGNRSVEVMFYRVVRMLFHESCDASWDLFHNVPASELLAEINQAIGGSFTTITAAVNRLAAHASRFISSREGVGLRKTMIDRQISLYQKDSGHFMITVERRKRDLETFFEFPQHVMDQETVNEVQESAAIDTHTGDEVIVASPEDEITHLLDSQDDEEEDSRSLDVEQADMIAKMFLKFAKTGRKVGGGLLRRRLEEFSGHEGYEFELEVVDLYLEKDDEADDEQVVFAYMQGYDLTITFRSQEPVDELYRI